MARQEVSLRDIDGDGYLDHVASSNDSLMTVARSRIDRTNLLKGVVRPLGASFELGYTRDGNTPDLPQSRWVLSKVTIDDGHTGDGVDTTVTTYQYAEGVYDRLERKFLGYGQIIAEERDSANGEALYRSTIQEYLTDSIYSSGLLRRERKLDATGNPFMETEHTYLLRDVSTGVEPANAQSTTATIFPQLVRTDSRFYEGGAAPGKSTFTTQHYDALGNIIELFDSGEAGAADDVLATISYQSCVATHIVGLPNAIVVTGNGTEMRRREATISCATGNLGTGP